MWRWWLSGFVVLLVAGVVGAESAPATDGERAARVSFDRFARGWLDKISSTRAAVGGGAPTVSEDFTTELRETGRSSVPWVGLLRYVEHSAVCADEAVCKVVNSTPVTEIFRFEGGRWVY